MSLLSTACHHLNQPAQIFFICELDLDLILSTQRLYAHGNIKVSAKGARGAFIRLRGNRSRRTRLFSD